MRLSEAALDDLRARNPVAPVADQLGARLRPVGRSMMGPCPICGGGRTATRFEAKSAEKWVCAVCQDGGDVIRLVQKTLGLDFRAAVDWLGGVDEIDPVTAARIARERAATEARRTADEDAKREVERKRLFRLWSEAVDIAGTPAWGYLVGRRIDVPGLRLRIMGAMRYYHGRSADGASPRAIYTGPAMLAAVTRPDGRFGGLHITWLHPAFDGRKAEILDPGSGDRLPAKKMRGTVRAGRIELTRSPPAPTRLVMGEGIETTASALAVEAQDDVAAATLYWAAGDLGNLGGPAAASVAHPTIRNAAGNPLRVPGPVPDLAAPAIPLPPSVTTAILIGDGDSDEFTTRAAITRAASRYRLQGCETRVAWAPSGMDLNDLLRSNKYGDGL